jgi:uncharacterized membrane protein
MSEVNVKLMFLVCFCLFIFIFYYSVYVLILIFGSYLIRIVINLIKNLLWVLFLFQGEEMVRAHISREADSSQCNKFEFD